MDLQVNKKKNHVIKQIKYKKYIAMNEQIKYQNKIKWINLSFFFLIILEMADGALNELNGAYATYMY